MKVRTKRIEINPEMLISILENNTAWRVTAGIPKGARLRGLMTDIHTQALHMFIEHPSFALVPINEVVPKLSIYFKKIK